MTKEEFEPAIPDNPILLHMQTPYNDVASLFSNLTCTFGRRRGGIIREGLEPRVWKQPNVTVQMTTTEEQRLYWRSVTSILNSMAKGKLYGKDRTCETLHERILNYTMTEEKTKDYLTDPRIKSVMDILTVFQQEYPNLMPSLHAMFEIAAGEGIAVALNTRTQNPPLELNDEKFISQTIDHDYGNHEIWCTGPAFARTIITQTQKAINDYSQTHDGESPDFLFNPFGEKGVGLVLRDHVLMLAKLTAENLSGGLGGNLIYEFPQTE